VSFRPTLRHLLLGLNVFILAAPLVAVFSLPLLDATLIRQTERSLIVQSVLIGETWRDRWLEARGLPPEGPAPEAAGTPEDLPWRFRPPGREVERYVPIQPTLDLTYQVLPPAEPARPAPGGAAGDPASAAAGRAVTPTLRRAQVFTLSGARIVDARGCIVASSRGEIGMCLDHLGEIRSALAGRYRALVRQRISDEPPPPVTSIRRRGRLRVFVATPIFHDGRVIGAVWMSRTSVTPLEMLFTHRGKVALLGLLCLVIVPAAAYFLSHQISKPARALTRRAEAVAHGTRAPDFEPGPLAPREVITLRDAFERMASQLTDRARSIEEFARTASHELKTPITAISGAAELLLDEADAMTPEQRRRFLSNIAADAAHMERIVTRLLQLAQVQGDPDRVEELDVASFLRGLLTRYREQIELDLEPGLPPLSMSPHHLGTALRNLVDNALRHGGGKGVRVRVRRRGLRVEIAVRDEGPGISPANRDRVFERFFTTARDSGGTGLGLSIVRAVADARGGRVELDTGPRGTEFRLLL
jgi:signal transduction histidine kinase